MSEALLTVVPAYSCGEHIASQLKWSAVTLQACLGASKKQLGADKFGDVVKTGSSTALAAVTLWNQVPGQCSSV